MSPLALLLAAFAAAQSPANYGAPDPSPPAPAAAPSASTAPAASAPKPGDGIHVAGEPGEKPKPKPARPIRAHIPKEAKDWEPLGLKEGGAPFGGSNAATLRIVKAKGGYKGERSKAKAFARAYPVGTGETLLVLALFPKSLERKRKHFELRFRVVEGNVEKVEAALVTVTDRRAYRDMDRVALRKAGAGFDEAFPASGLVSLAAFDPRPGRNANVGKLSLGEFADADAGFADLSWSLSSVEKP